jgi:hypothetical protein
MTRPLLPGARSGLLVEYILMLAVLASFGWVVWFYLTYHYLPQPFIFNTFDTFMDWFNTADFAHRPGAYDKWHSIYPPLSFVFLGLFSIDSCYGSSVNARDCDWIGITAILSFYALSVVLAFATFWRANRASAIPRGLSFALGFPILFCVERGNLIVVGLIPFIIAYGNLAEKRPFWRWLSIAVTINFKPYLITAALALGVKRKWRALEAAGLLTIFVFIASLALFGSGDPMTLYENAGGFVQMTDGQFWEQSYFSTSYASLLLVKTSPFPILQYVGSELVETIAMIIPVVVRTSQLATIAGIVAAWLQPQAVSLARLAALFTCCHLVAFSPGGYTLTFLIFLVFLEPARRPGPMVALVCCYVLSLSYDWLITTVVQTDLLSWLSGEAVSVKFGLAIGHLVRPGLVVLIAWSLAIDTIIQVAKAHRHKRPLLRLAPA